MNLEIDEQEFRNSLYEVSEILNRLEVEEYKKIPRELLRKIEFQKNNSHNWEYNESLDLYKQNFSEYTQAILAMINLEYLLTPEKKSIMSGIHKLIEYI